jgi:S1-C subfamily serine protease
MRRGGGNQIWAVPASAVIAVLAFAAVSASAASPTAPVAEAVLQAEQQRIAAVARAVPSAVAVFANDGQGGGSGVVITPDGYALSNFHVTKPAGDYMQCGMADGNLYDAVIVGLDPTGDVALIKLLGRDDFPFAEMADSDQLRVGDWCFAVGNPFLLATDFQPTVTYGLVSGVNRYQYPAGTLLEYADCIQTDASINPGNSGGPLFDAAGRLIGINGRGSFEKRGRVNVGVGYAISINQIKNFLGYLHSGRIVDHATLGATVARDEDGRIVVTDILPTCDAYRRGLRYGDELLSFAGRPITTVNGFKNVLGIFPKGWRVPLGFRHQGERRDVYVRLMGVHTDEELLRKAEGALPVEQPPMPKPSPPEGTPDGDRSPEKPEKKPIKIAPKIPSKPPRIMPKDRAHRQQPPPKHVEPWIAKRPGYANYRFNELNRDRVWNALVAHGDFAGLTGAWKLTGVDAAGNKIEIELGGEKVTARFGTRPAMVELARDLDSQLAPDGSGGLLAALHLWQRLLRLGPKQFGDVYYLGTAPVPDRPGLADVLIATHNVVEARFLFDPETGQLIGMEMYPDAQVDPCEIYFADYRSVAGRQVPHALLVRHGDAVYGRIQLESFELIADKS